MSKSKVTTTIDSNLYELANQTNLSFSEVLESGIRAMLELGNSEITPLEIEQIKVQINYENDQIAVLKTSISEKEKKIEQYHLKLQRAEQKYIAAQTAAIESMRKKEAATQKCLECGKDMEKDEKTMAVRNGVVCRNCYLTAPYDHVKEWMK